MRAVEQLNYMTRVTSDRGRCFSQATEEVADSSTPSAAASSNHDVFPGCTRLSSIFDLTQQQLFAELLPAMAEARPTSAGSSVAERLRRSISAARAAEAIKDNRPSSACLTEHLYDDDSSLVLFGDPSGVSAQRSRASVMSGAHEQGETFFTALKRQPPGQDDTEFDGCVTGSLQAGGLSGAASEVNPVQSPSDSAFFSALNDGSEDYSLLDGDGNSKPDLRASAESSNATYAMGGEAQSMLDGCTGAVANSCCGGQLTCAVLDIIKNVYGGGEEAANSQPWQHVTPEDQPLMALTVSATLDKTARAEGAAANDKAHPTSCMVGCEGSSSSMEPTDAARQQVRERVQEDEQASAADNPAEVQLASSVHEQTCEVQDTEADRGSSIEGQALLAGMDELLAEHSRLHQELDGYLQQLSSRAGDDGLPLVQLDDDYAVRVERLLREGRAQHYRALQGWDGPHRFEELPVAQLRSQHADPELAAGLAAIAKLDEDLREASLKALITARALNPEQWADAEKRRLERRAEDLDAALAKERQRRAHAAKLRGVLSRLDKDCSAASFQALANGNGCNSYYKLKPQEEDLLAAVLLRDDAVLEAENPFDPMMLCLDDDGDSIPTSHGQPTNQGAAQQGPTDGGNQAGCSSQASSISVFDLMRPSTGFKGRRFSLADIDAKLDVIQVERQNAQLPRTSSAGISRTTSSRSTVSTKRMLSAQNSTGRAGSANSTAGAAGGNSHTATHTPHDSSARSASSAGGTRHSTAHSRPSRRCSGSSSSMSGRSGSTVHNIDYIRDQREAKEQQQRERELDAQLRELQTSELPSKLTQQQLQRLLQCAY